LDRSPLPDAGPTILGPEVTCELVLPEDAAPLIDRIALKGSTIIVDPKSREVSVNPLSPDMPLLDLMACA
jgi:hypothetical protein